MFGAVPSGAVADLKIGKPGIPRFAAELDW
jgi:hypothetical protein